MKRMLTVALLALAAVCLSSRAFALSFSADVPLQFQFSSKFLNANQDAKPKDRTVSDVNGIILGVGAGWVGVGYENYTVGATGNSLNPNSPLTFDFNLNFQFYDVFLDLPFPFLHPEIGYGKGRVSPDLKPVFGQKIQAKDADASQYFLRLGVPIGHLFDIHVGYHVIKAEDIKVPQGGNGPDKLKASGQTVTAGVRLGW